MATFFDEKSNDANWPSFTNESNVHKCEFSNTVLTFCGKKLLPHNYYPLHEWRLNLNSSTLHIEPLFPDKGLLTSMSGLGCLIVIHIRSHFCKGSLGRLHSFECGTCMHVHEARVCQRDDLKQTIRHQ